MAYSSEQYITTTATNGPFAIPFSYLARADVKVDVNGALAAFTFLSDFSVTLVTQVPPGTSVRVWRDTPKAARLVNFQDATVLNEADLDRDSDQIMFIAQEAFDATGASAAASASAAAASASQALEQANAATVAAALAVSTAATVPNDTTLVHRLGDETIAGVKTFSSPPSVPAATASDNPVRKDTFDSVVLDLSPLRATKLPRGRGNVNNFMAVAMSDGNVKAWGFNSNGQVGMGGTSSAAHPRNMAFAPGTTPPPVGTAVVDVQVVGFNTFVLYANGWLYACGYNGFGQLGDGTTTRSLFLKRIEYFVSNGLSVTSFRASGTWHSAAYVTVIALCSNGKPYVWGNGYRGDGSAGGSILTPSPVPLTGISGIALSSDAAGPAFFAWTAAGVLSAWGSNHQGLLGIGSAAHPVLTATPTTTPWGGASVTDVVSITGYDTSGEAGSFYGSTVVLTADGKLWGSGYNGQGQLGDGSTTNKNSFGSFSGTTGLTFVGVDCAQAGPYSVTAALRSDGVLMTCGYGANGALGDGTAANRTVLTAIPGTWSKVVGNRSVSNQSSMLAWSATDGLPYMFGHDTGGALGSGGTVVRTTPFKIPVSHCLRAGETVDGLTILAYSGNCTAIALTSRGRVLTCGYGSNGETGTGFTAADQYSFQPVSLNV